MFITVLSSTRPHYYTVFVTANDTHISLIRSDLVLLPPPTVRSDMEDGITYPIGLNLHLVQVVLTRYYYCSELQARLNKRCVSMKRQRHTDRILAS